MERGNRYRADDENVESPEQAEANSAGTEYKKPEDVGLDQPDVEPAAMLPVPVIVLDGPPRGPDSPPRFETGRGVVGAPGQQYRPMSMLGKQPMRKSITIRNINDTAQPLYVVAGNRQGSEGFVVLQNQSLTVDTTAAIFLDRPDGQTVAYCWIATFHDEGVQ